MNNRMSFASRKTVWLLRAAFFVTLVAMAVVCVKNYQDNAKQTLAVSDLVQFSERFHELQLATEGVNVAARDFENSLNRIKSSVEISEDRAANIKSKLQTVETKLTAAHEKADKFDLLFLSFRDGKRSLYLDSNTQSEIARALKKYQTFLAPDRFADAKSELRLIMRVGPLLWEYNEGIIWARNIIQTNITKQYKYLKEVGNNRDSKFLLITASILLVIALMIFLPADIIISRLLAGFEITRRETEVALENAKEADRAKSEFLATMSHEIRTPMNGVLGMAELLNKTQLDSRQRTFSEVILKSSNSLLEIINDILDFSKIDAQQLRLQDEVSDVGELVGEIATLLAIKASEKDVELAMRIQPDLPKGVMVDSVRLRQCIINILGNAIKFTEKGHVLIDVTRHESEKKNHALLKFKIEDTGIGIAEDKIDNIFEKFSQVDSSNTRRFEGTGLGLAISARLIEMMGGKIGVVSQLGVGTTFSFSLDLLIEDNDDFEPVSEITHEGPVRALIVDDNEVNRSILIEQLSSWGYECVAVENGITGIEFLNAARNEFDIKVDFVILDFQMPGMSGLEVLQEIRETEDIADTKVLLLSSVDQSDFINSLKEYHLDGLLSKPARSADLKAAINHVLSGSQISHLRSALQLMKETETSATAIPDQTNTSAEPDATSGQENYESQLDILVCEDNEVNQMVISQYLEIRNYNFKIVENGKLGVTEWSASKPRVVLMDVSMPEMNGREATQRIRQIEQEEGLSHTPIIGVTAHAQAKDKEECLQSGMDDVLTKPLASEDLFEALDNVFCADDAKEIASHV